METTQIKDYEDYLISIDGIVTKNGKRLGFINAQGYPSVCLCKNGTKKFKTIHRLVALHFISNPNSKKEVDHIDRNRTNNHISNLRWCSSMENGRNKTIIVGSNKYTGITWCNTMKQYRARIRIQRKDVLMGYAKTENEAAEIYNKYLIDNSLDKFWKLIDIIY